MKKGAYSLLELAVVIAIISFILSTVTIGYSSFYDKSKYTNNITKLANIRIAIENYFGRYGFLPCPADPTLPITDPNFGVEKLDSTGTGCSGDYITTQTGKANPIKNQSRVGSNNYFLFGAVPVRTLGLSDKAAFDMYSNRITFVIHDSLANYKRHNATVYRNLYGYGNVSLRKSSDASGKFFGNSSSCSMSSFIGLFGNTSAATTSQNYYRMVMNTCNAQIKDSSSDSVISGTKDNLAFLLISYGSSGLGGWNNSGILNALPSSDQEKANSYAFYVDNNGTYTSNYVFDNTGNVSKPLSFYTGVNSGTFSHTVVYKTVSDLLQNNTSQAAISCLPTSHPGFLLYPGANPNDSDPYSSADMYYTANPITPELKQNGQQYTINGITKTCTGYGTWM